MKCDKDELETRQWVLLGTEQLEERIYQKLDELLMSDDRDNIFAMVEEIKRCEKTSGRNKNGTIFYNSK